VCGVSERDLESSIMKKPWPTSAIVPWLRKDRNESNL
jgi:hypothetical protein